MFRFSGYFPVIGTHEAYLLYELLLFIFCLMGGVISMVGVALLCAVLVPGYRPMKLEGGSIEYAWTVFPIVILLAVAVPTLNLTYRKDEYNLNPQELIIVGHQWYWEYKCNSMNTLAYTSKQDLLTTDASILCPVSHPVHLSVTSADVVHNFNIKPLAISLDAIPGRVQEKLVFIKYAGVYQGLCSEVCGVGHYSMAISLEASKFFYGSFKCSSFKRGTWVTTLENFIRCVCTLFFDNKSDLSITV